MFSDILGAGSRGHAILLDLDDTIVTDDVISEETWRGVCRRFAPYVRECSSEELYDAIKNTAVGYWGDPRNHSKGRLNLVGTRREIVRLALRGIGIGDDEFADKLADTYSSEKESAITLIPGAIDTLRSFKEYGLRLAMITNGNSEVQRRKIRRFGLDAIFDFILIESEFGVGKPDARVFYTVLKELNVVASAACMIGDDLDRDIAGAQRLGIYSIWVDWRYSGLPLHSRIKPDCIINTLSQLIKDNG
jgi:putative hydrolase of the HAD superfamily